MNHRCSGNGIDLHMTAKWQMLGVPIAALLVEHRSQAEQPARAHERALRLDSRWRDGARCQTGAVGDGNEVVSFGDIDRIRIHEIGSDEPVSHGRKRDQCELPEELGAGFPQVAPIGEPVPELGCPAPSGSMSPPSLPGPAMPCERGQPLLVDLPMRADPREIGERLPAEESDGSVLVLPDHALGWVNRKVRELGTIEPLDRTRIDRGAGTAGKHEVR